MAKAMSKEHKEALAEGREQSRAVRAYLDALESNAPKRGRKRTPESIDSRVAAIDEQLADADMLKRVSLVQERLDLTSERERLTSTVPMEEFEAQFIAAAKGYSERKGITRSAWREIGVPASVLKAAGL